jgi:hypothetical protein
MTKHTTEAGMLAEQGGQGVAIAAPRHRGFRAAHRAASRLAPTGFNPTIAGPRFVVSVQHKSTLDRDGVWYPLTETDDAELARHELEKFSLSYGRPVRITDRQKAGEA